MMLVCEPSAACALGPASKPSSSPPTPTRRSSSPVASPAILGARPGNGDGTAVRDIGAYEYQPPFVIDPLKEPSAYFSMSAARSSSLAYGPWWVKTSFAVAVVEERVGLARRGRGPAHSRGLPGREPSMLGYGSGLSRGRSRRPRSVPRCRPRRTRPGRGAARPATAGSGNSSRHGTHHEAQLLTTDRVALDARERLVVGVLAAVEHLVAVRVELRQLAAVPSRAPVRSPERETRNRRRTRRLRARSRPERRRRVRGSAHDCKVPSRFARPCRFARGLPLRLAHRH